MTRPEAPASARPGIIPFGAAFPLFASLLLFDILYWGDHWRPWAADAMASLTNGNGAAGLVWGLILGLSGLPVLGGTWIAIRRAAGGGGTGRFLGLVGAIAATLVLGPFDSLLIGTRNGSDFDFSFNRRVPNAQTGYLIGLFGSLGGVLLALWLYQRRVDRRSPRHGRGG